MASAHLRQTRSRPGEPFLKAPALAKRDDVVETIHGVKVADPYRWIEKSSDPRVQEWVQDMDRPAPYVVDQFWYPSKDGTKISMFLIHKKTMKKNGDNPTLLYGYGGFNVSLTADSDDRADPMHAKKFVAQMRWATQGRTLVLLRVETKSGHGGET